MYMILINGVSWSWLLSKHDVKFKGQAFTTNIQTEVYYAKMD